MGIKVSKKTLTRSDWPRVVKRKYAWMDVCDEQFCGQASLILIEEVTMPLVKTYDGISVKIVDQGYCWLQLAPEGKTYWLTVMIDAAGSIVSYYFDITDRNVLLENGDSYFMDMFLDVVLLPGGRLYLLDEDELADALEQGEISQKQFDMAYQTARMLLAQLQNREKELEDYCLKTVEALGAKLSMQKEE